MEPFARGRIVRAGDRLPRELANGWATELDCVGAEEGAEALSVRVYRLRPTGGAGPFHLHSDSESVYFVLSGAVNVRLGEAQHRLGESDLAFIPPAVPHSIANAGEQDAVVLEIYAPGTADFVRLD